LYPACGLSKIKVSSGKQLANAGANFTLTGGGKHLENNMSYGTAWFPRDYLQYLDMGNIRHECLCFRQDSYHGFSWQ
jgi:hypothetical protein